MLRLIACLTAAVAFAVNPAHAGPTSTSMSVSLPALQDTPFVSVLVPGTRYDASIPTLEQVVGHDFAEDITRPDEIAEYLRALAEAAPDRTHLFEYARSWEGRPLHMLVIGSPDRIARLDEVKAGMARLADPDGLPDAEAEELIASLPVVVAMVHSIHGNEVTPAGAAMAEAYHLLAAQNDPRVETILREALVLIDPIQNPDGRARFVAHYRQSRAFPPDPDPAAAGHDEPWPGGRTNHYLFDLNRDWFPLTQPESRGKIRTLLEFNPQVLADLHEMGGNSTYYFPPAAIPGNPWTTAAQHASFELLGRAMADAFDARGFPYFTREIFDSYYPGYGASWPTTHGAMGMTFEQASPRGLVLRRNDGDLLTYGDGILHQFTAAMATMHTAAANRERMLRDFLEFRRSALRLPREGGPAAYILHSGHDPELARRLAVLLARNGIEVHRAEEPVRAGGRTLSPGSYIVPGGQPAARLARNLLDPYTPMSEEFVQRQIERRAQRLPDEIYDITAWSLPLLWDVEAITTDRVPEVRTVPVPADPPAPSPMTLPPARAGYLMPWSSATAATVAEAQREGLRVRVLAGSTVIDGRAYGIGAALFRTTENPAGLAARLGAIAARHGARAFPVDDSFKEEGISLGSNRVVSLPPPSVMLVYDSPGRSYSVGWARYVLEQRYGIPVTAVRSDIVTRVDLADYDVIILPSGNYASVFDDEGVEELREWMRRGGTLVTLAESSRWAVRAGLLATSTELRGGAPEFGGERPSSRTAMEQPIDLLEAITPDVEPPEQTPGAILNVVMDTTHWLSAGTDGRIGALVSSNRIFTPLTLDEGTNVGIYAPLDDLVAGGIVWEDARPQLANKAFLMHQPTGRGQLVAFAEDPNYRAYAEATELVFVNAVLFGAAR